MSFNSAILAVSVICSHYQDFNGADGREPKRGINLNKTKARYY